MTGGTRTSSTVEGNYYLEAHRLLLVERKKNLLLATILAGTFTKKNKLT